MAVIIDDKERKFEFTILPLEEVERGRHNLKRIIRVYFKNLYIAKYFYFEKCAEAMTEVELRNTVRSIDLYFAEKVSEYCVPVINNDYRQLDYRFVFSENASFIINLPCGDSISISLKDNELLAIRDEIVNAIDMSDYVPPISGNMKEITLVSEKYNSQELQSGEEYSQRINIKNKGQVNIKYFDIDGKLLRSEDIVADVTYVDEVFSDLFSFAIEAECNDNPMCDIVLAGNKWKLTIVNDAGKEFYFSGYGEEEGLEYISENIRELTKRRKLWVFDGNAQEGIKFCSVEFGEASQDYYYITDDESIEIEDLVKVPVGKNNRECIATVVDIEYFKEDDVPMPLDRVKKIICKYIPKDNTDDRSMAVILTEGDKRLEFSVISYQYSFRSYDDYDDNWLIVKIDYCDNEKKDTYTDPSILNFELESFIEDIEDIISGKKTAVVSDFLEPYLNFAVTKDGDIFSVKVSFVYDTMSDEWKEVSVSQCMSIKELQQMNDGLKYYLNKFPYREPKKSKIVAKCDGNAQEGIKFCSVEFGEASQDYYYITDDESIEIEDLVKVPVGKNNRECIATVVNIEYFKEDNLPMPLDKVKKIICKYIPKEKTDDKGEDDK